jgi:hypothetical protein
MRSDLCKSRTLIAAFSTRKWTARGETIMKHILASFTIALAACSSNPLDPGAGSQVGTGTSTLLVAGRASAEPNTPNTREDTQFTTNFEISVSLNNAAVTTGTVTVKSRTATTTLTYNPNGGQFGRWEGSVANYDEVYEFSIKSGTDSVTNVYVDGPDIQMFTKPTAGAALDATMAQPIAWSRGARASEARFTVGDGNGVVVDDSGTYTMPPGSLNTDAAQARPNTLRLTRTNNLTPKGGAAGSELSVSVAQELDVVAMPCPVGC